jgi:ComF family protein
MLSVHSLWKDFTHLFYPQICAGCGSDVITADSPLCIRCIASLPLTNFHFHTGNQVEKIFWGRIPVTYATSLCYFNSGSLIQTLLHQLKYKGHKDLGYFLGRLMGETLIQSNRFSYLDALIPLPLFAAREKKRGYNQAALLCEGMSEAMKIPVFSDAVMRRTATSTQTKKNRLERWENIEGKFVINNPSLITGKHVLLVDDVITTGATLESCGNLLLQIPGTKLSIATLAYTIK